MPQPSSIAPATTPQSQVEVGLPSREFLILWIVANAVTPLLAALVGLVSSWTGDLLAPLEFVVNLALLALPQWFVLRRYLLGLRAIEWLWRTLLGLLGGVVGVAAGIFAFFTLDSSVGGLGLLPAGATSTTPVLAVTFAAMWLVIGLVVGAVQWPALERYASGRWFAWGLANAFSFGLSMGLSQLVLALEFRGFVSDLVSAFVSGLLSGLITGLVLLRLLRQPVSVQVQYAKEERAAAIADGVRVASSAYTPGPKKKRRKGRR